MQNVTSSIVMQNVTPNIHIKLSNFYINFLRFISITLNRCSKSSEFNSSVGEISYTSRCILNLSST